VNERQLEQLLHMERLQAFFQHCQWLELREENIRLRFLVLKLQQVLERHEIRIEMNLSESTEQLYLPLSDEVQPTETKTR
jgi:hypothetical protein